MATKTFKTGDVVIIKGQPCALTICPQPPGQLPADDSAVWVCRVTSEAITYHIVPVAILVAKRSR